MSDGGPRQKRFRSLLNAEQSVAAESQWRSVESRVNGCDLLQAAHAMPLTNHPLSAPNASDRLLSGPSTGPPDGPMSAHQLPSASGSKWLARVIVSCFVV